MPTHLYEDPAPLARIQGYAAVYSATYPIAGGLWERVAAGAFRLGAKPIFLAICHDHGRRYAWTADCSLRVWSDRYGLAVEAVAEPNASGLTLIGAIRREGIRGLSINFSKREVEHVNERGRDIAVVRAAEIDEVSLTWQPASPCATCWLDDDPPDELPAYVAQARAYWLAGRMAARLAAERPQVQAPAQVRARASARATKPVCPPSVVAVLDRYGLSYPR